MHFQSQLGKTKVLFDNQGKNGKNTTMCCIFSWNFINTKIKTADENAP
jgi:hypothetical protein